MILKCMYFLLHPTVDCWEGMKCLLSPVQCGLSCFWHSRKTQEGAGAGRAGAGLINSRSICKAA